MTAIDFAAFVGELAAVSGETIRPFFRSALGAGSLGLENKSRSGASIRSPPPTMPPRPRCGP